jgi:beta-mannan synthase
MHLLALAFGAYYPLWVAALRGAIALFTLLSLLVSADRMLCVAKFCFIRARARLTGRLPQHAWEFKPLPADADAYPKVRARQRAALAAAGGGLAIHARHIAACTARTAQNYILSAASSLSSSLLPPPPPAPQVAVQLPMFNERAVCQSVIDCCAELDWPAHRLLIQVLDDSTDPKTRALVDEKAAEWRERGVAIDVLRRTNRQGYKAGAMKEGMDALAADGYAYVAVFDADFKPEPDFLLRTVPYLEGNPRVGYVQARWVFSNPEESYLTKAQEVSLNYHMRCEQYAHSATGSFFNFNGTAGVWRAACVADAGGWNSRTTVEDMDLSLRAFLKGWKAIFLDDVTCLNELPASFFAYRKQQHRWTAGPAQLWSKAARDIAAAALPPLRKAELVVMYFGVRKAATHFVALGFFCALVPLSVLTPEAAIPAWVLCHLPVAVTLSTAAFTPRGWVYSVLYVIFENGMSMVKLWAVVTGLLDLQRAQEWVVTTKLGSSDRRPGTAAALVPSCKIYPGELGMGLFLFAAGAAALLAGRHWGMAAYLLLQAGVFLAFGFNAVDVGGPLGGRLDAGALNTPAAALAAPAAAAALGRVGRAATIPVIRLAGGDAEASAPPTREALAGAASAPVGGRLLGRIDTAAGVSILEALEGGGVARSASPTASAESGGAGRSAGSDAGSEEDALLHAPGVKTPDKAAARPGGAAWWPSPTSSLANIYAPGAGKGWRAALAGGGAEAHID